MFALGNVTFARGVCSAHERSLEEACGETEVGRHLLAPEPRPLPLRTPSRYRCQRDHWWTVQKQSCKCRKKWIKRGFLTSAPHGRDATPYTETMEYQDFVLLWGWLVILPNCLDAPGISRMNHFTAEIVSLVKHLSGKVFITWSHTDEKFIFVFE